MAMIDEIREAVSVKFQGKSIIWDDYPKWIEALLAYHDAAEAWRGPRAKGKDYIKLCQAREELGDE